MNGLHRVDTRGRTTAWGRALIIVRYSASDVKPAKPKLRLLAMTETEFAALRATGFSRPW